jgi:hypothetical protein
LKKGPKAISHDTLKALWCALDVDDGNSLLKDEVAGFFRRGTKAKPAKPQMGFAGGGGAATISDRVGTGVALACQPTKEMRAELKEKAVVLPDDNRLISLSQLFNKKLEMLRYDQNKAKASSVHALFREVDEDKSGFIVGARSLTAHKRRARSLTAHKRRTVPSLLLV